MKIRLASGLQKDSVVDGPGIRTVIWTQGCAHACKGCHNPHTHDFRGGFEVELDELKDEIKNLELQSGITFSGGDPLYQIEAVLELSKFIKNLNMDIWVYTGFTYEEILDMPLGRNLLKTIDILVDGKFDINLRSLDATFRGSTNQRIIDTRESVKKGKIILKEEYMIKKKISKYTKEEKIYI